LSNRKKPSVGKRCDKQYHHTAKDDEKTAG
jgi:hypothetical protein